MAEKKKDDKNTVEERVEEALSDALEEELGEIPEASISVEELRRLEKTNRKNNHRRLAKFVSVAAVAVVVCAAVVYLAWPESMVPVDADKNTEQRVQDGDGEIIINDGDVEGDSGIVTIKESNWHNVEQYKHKLPQLAIPEFIPDGYSFMNLTIEKSDSGSFTAEYLFINSKKKSLYVSQLYYKGQGIKTRAVGGDTRLIKTEFGNVYIVEDTNKTAITYINDGHFKVVGTLDEGLLINILEGIRMP